MSLLQPKKGEYFDLTGKNLCWDVAMTVERSENTLI